MSDAEQPTSPETSGEQEKSGGARSAAAAQGKARTDEDWRPLLRALAEELDRVAGPTGRDTLLHGVGRQLAHQFRLGAAASLPALAREMNDVLASFGWGQVHISFSQSKACLYLTHRGLPRIGGRGEPPGAWLASMLVGLYEGWLGEQPGADPSFRAQRLGADETDEIVIRYGTWILST